MCECGRWAEINQERETRRRGWPWARRTEQKWFWCIKRPDLMMPFGFRISGAGFTWSYEQAEREAREYHEQLHDNDRRLAAIKRIDFKGEV